MRWLSYLLLSLVLGLTGACSDPSGPLEPPSRISRDTCDGYAPGSCVPCPGAPFEVCEPEPHCYPGSYCYQDPREGADGYYIAKSWDECVAPNGRDNDADGLRDDCEEELARKFAPELVFAPDCNLDYTTDPNGVIGGQFVWAAQIPTDRPDRVRIAYMPSYYMDCGLDEWDPPHSGDSEFILIDLVYFEQNEHWYFERAFLSSYCTVVPGYQTAGNINRYCKWYDPQYFQWVSEPGFEGRTNVAPLVFVAVGSHSHYPDVSTCNRRLGDRPDVPSYYVQEHCPGTMHLRMGALGPRNAGTGQAPFPYAVGHDADCVQPFQFSNKVDMSKYECYWRGSNPADFNGWQVSNVGSDAFAYSVVLGLYARF